MKCTLRFLLPFLFLPSGISFADDGFYMGVGLNSLDLDSEHSVNLSITAGYDIYRWNFTSNKINSLELSAEGQYSDSISGTDEVKNYSVFWVARAYTSEQLYFKVKQGITNFPDMTLIGNDAEQSHFGVGIGIGYKLGTGFFELDYVYPNKTLHASSFEISYKFHF
jgi:hypothetical protein